MKGCFGSEKVNVHMYVYLSVHTAFQFKYPDITITNVTVRPNVVMSSLQFFRTNTDIFNAMNAKLCLLPIKHSGTGMNGYGVLSAAAPE